MAQLHCVVVTPEATALEQAVDFVALPLFDGEIGIYANHSPMIGRLGYGEMRIVNGGSTERYYVDGGFVQIADNIVSVLTKQATLSSDVDAGEASKALADAQKAKANTPELMDVRDRAVTQARAQLRVAKKG